MEEEVRKNELITEITGILNEVESIKIVEYFNNFIKIAVTKWK